MGFITSYFIVCFLGLFAHPLIKKQRAKGNKAFAMTFSVGVTFGMLMLDVLIYIGVLNFLWSALSDTIPWIDIANGRDFMWNSFSLIGIDFGVDYMSTSLDSIAFVLFMSYIPWFVMQKDGSKMLFGQKNYQEGYMWALTPIKKPKDYKNKKK